MEMVMLIYPLIYFHECNLCFISFLLYIVTKGGLGLKRIEDWSIFNRFPVVFDIICTEKSTSELLSYAKYLSSKDREVWME